jgi:hypothetical protein
LCSVRFFSSRWNAPPIFFPTCMPKTRIAPEKA